MVRFVLAEQTWIFIRAAVLGVCLGIFYDILRIVRILSRARRWKTIFYDLLLWAVLAGAFFLFIMDAAGGIARSYVFLGAGCGACLYFLSLSAVLVAGGVKTAEGVAAGAAFLSCPWRRLGRQVREWIKSRKKSKKK